MRCLFAILSLAATVSAASPQGFYRTPAIRGNTIVFASEGDLWRVQVKGGIAQRLTTHAGSESYPAISPDGKTVAFAAAIEGKSEVYTMPIAGGVPMRRTFDACEPRFISWTPEGRILFSTDKHSTLPDYQLVTLDTGTNVRTLLPLAQASAGSFAPDGTLYFVRMGKQSSATKRYRGGWIENLWKYKDGDAEAVALDAGNKSTNRSPMWWNDRVYFVSDRDGMMNLWSMKPDGSDTKQHTTHKDNDVRNPSLDEGRIVYRLGADLRLYDIAANTDTPLTIRLTSDFDQQREQWVKKPFEYLTSWHASPAGDRVVLTARGEVFVAPFNPGRLVELPRKEGVRYRNASLMPDGKTVLMQSDASDEIEFWTSPANGTAEPTQVTNDGHIHRFGSKASPDGKWFAWADKNLELWVHNIEKKVSTMVAKGSGDDPINDFQWSPDSQWIAFVDEAPNTYKQIKLYSVADAKTVVPTTDRTNSYSPAWSHDGNWLYFLSDRDLKTLVQSPWGHFQPEPFYSDITKVYMLALHKGQKSPFRPHDELTGGGTSEQKAEEMPDRVKGVMDALIKQRLAVALRQMGKGGNDQPMEGGKKSGKGKGAKKEADDANKDEKPEIKKAEPVAKPIEVDGLITRIEEVPIPAGNYDDLSATEKHLFFTSKPTGFKTKTSVMRFDIAHKRNTPVIFVEDASSYELCAKEGKAVVRKGDAFWAVDTNGPAPAALNNSAELGGWTFAINPVEEWHQIYRDSWRMMRDYFYDRNMHGLDWKAMRKKYEPLVDRVTERSDLNEILQDLLGELSALHIYVRYGDDRNVPTIIETASLGSTVERDDAAGGWRVKHQWKTDPDYPEKSAPLGRPGIDIGEGDVITKINGRSTLDVAHPDALLLNKAGKQVLLEVKHGNEQRQVIFKPVEAQTEADLRYAEWEYTRRLKVDELSDGKIGYVHLRAMGEDDMAQWAREFYPQFQKQGLIIDVRHNRGGNIDSWILEKLLRKAWSYFARPVGEAHWNMQYAFRGHITVLCDAKTASDGEGFSEGFRRLGLGKVIGTRTWGGQIWLSAQKWLVDSGMATAAEMGVYSPEGQWLIEGEGVHPDIEVDNLPHQTFLGKDAQLEAGIAHLQELITKEPRPAAPIPPRPKKIYSDDDKVKK